MKRHSFVRGMLPYIGKECSGQGVFRAQRCLKTVSPCGVAGGDFLRRFAVAGKVAEGLGRHKTEQGFFYCGKRKSVL